MKQTKQNWREIRIPLRDYAGKPDPWGTNDGTKIFGRLNGELSQLDDLSLVVIDYSGIERTDVSVQREAVVETLRKHRPKLLFVADNLADRDLVANLEAALIRRGDSLIRRTPSGPDVVGKALPPEHLRLLKLAWREGELTSAQVVAAEQKDVAGKAKEVKLSTASSRLIALWKAGLVARVEGTSPTGGREHRYYAFA